MNIHPLFVHFPIGLLVVYSFLEIGGYLVPALRRQTWLFSVRTFLLFTGVLAALAALVTGGIAEELVEGVHPRAYILETHAGFAVGATLAYLILSAAYLNRIFDRNGWFDKIVASNRFLVWGWSIKKRLARLILDTSLSPLFAFLGLALLSVAGALGATIVYGPQIDPFISLTYHLFWAQ